MTLPGPVRLLRPKQWTKNLLVTAALIFTGQFSNQAAVFATLLAFTALCLASSSVYCLNDLLDAEKDRHHPKKKFRPIASGEVSPQMAVVLAISCCLASILVSLSVRWELTAGILFYLIIQLGYNFLFKKKPVLDVFVLGLGFVLRAGLGAVAIGVTISAWLLFCTGALSLLLGFAKRRSEFMMEGHDVTKTRPALAGYNQATLDALVLFSASIAGISYGIYAIQSRTAQAHNGLILTVPLVMYGVARYLYLALSQNEGGEPETLLFTDCHMIFVVVLYLVVAILAMLGLEIPHVSGLA